MDRLTIERIGGLAGFGGPVSKLQSRGEQAMSALSVADRASVEALFSAPARAKGDGLVRDGFRYRITRTGRNGRDQTVEVPEAAVPTALRASVVDRLE